MATKRKDGAVIGRAKKTLMTITERRSRGRPDVPFLEDPDRYRVAFYAAFKRLTKMRTVRGNRTLGYNMAAKLFTALFKGDLLEGGAAGDVTGAPKNFAKNCPAGATPIVPMQRGRDEPLTIQQVAGAAKAMQKKEVKVLETGDNATLRWFTEAVKIFGLVLAGTVQNNQSQILEAKGRAD